MNKRLSVPVMLCLLVLALAPQGHSATLQFWTPVWNTAVQKWLHEVAIPDFERENPGTKVEVMYGEWGTWSDKLTIAFASGTFPDVYVIHAEAPRLHTRLGWAMPLDRFLEGWPGAKDFIPDFARVALHWQATPYYGNNWMQTGMDRG